MVNDKSAKRKVLIVSFRFPPLNNIAAVRIGKFAKYLPEFGWEPIVLTVNEMKGYPQTLPMEIDEANIIRTPYFALAPLIRSKLADDEIAPSQKISKGLNWRERVYQLIRLTRFIYSRPEVTFFTNEHWGWYSYAMKKGLEVIKKSKIDIIFSTFGYEMMPHFIASRLHQRTGVPWIAEFRDPWTFNNPYIKKPQPFHFMTQQLEKRVMKGSNLLISVSEPLAKDLEAFHSKKTIVIPNGFDEEDYTENIPLTSKFIITYTGTISPGKGDPTPLFKAITELKHEGQLSTDDFEVRFFGSNVAEILSPPIEKYCLQELVKVYSLVPFKESIKKQKESVVLLLLRWNDPRDKGMYTGKFFEYLGAGRPILAMAFKGGEIDKLLIKSGCGIVLNEPDEIKALLLKWLQEFRQYGEIISHYKPNWEVVKQYTRREQTRKLAAAFDKVVDSKGQTMPLGRRGTGMNVKHI
ncbi:glycosyltransferase [Thermodesulfovibrionales bacterium]|nr:glycosyltransferase [Thermodesulfovibrionales bacterium]